MKWKSSGIVKLSSFSTVGRLLLLLDADGRAFFLAERMVEVTPGAKSSFVLIGVGSRKSMMNGAFFSRGLEGVDTSTSWLERDRGV